MVSLTLFMRMSCANVDSKNFNFFKKFKIESFVAICGLNMNNYTEMSTNMTSVGSVAPKIAG